ncbi:MAG: D-sedoheptulose 7-phosphate isomerase [Pseudomonadota bacterium]|nr:D-sedoheptulose 7-phosphate isomerase [Pseudomonadota bacterium]
MRELVKATLEEHTQVVKKMVALESEIVSAGKLCANALAQGQSIYLCGNGGSAADAQHIAAELIGRFVSDRRSLPAIALTTDTSVLTAIGNDYGYDEVFSRQVEGLCRKGDVLIAISTSGNSTNVLRAVDAAHVVGSSVIGLLGKSGGVLKRRCDVPLIVPSDVTARIQEMHIVIGHLICALVEKHLDLGAR